MFVFTSTLTIYFGVTRVLNPEEIDHIFIAYIVLVGFIFSNGYAFSVSSRRLLDGKRWTKIFYMFRNSDFIETKSTVVLDFIGTLSAIIGIVALILYQATGNMRFDGFGAIAIGLSVMVITLFLIFDTRSLLIGRNASASVERKIKKIVKDEINIQKLLHLTTINIGLGRVSAILEVHLKDNLVTDEIEKTIEELELKIKKAVPEVKVIHIELRTKKSKRA